ncbi:MCE family protein [Pseudoalteromonas sp. C2R02]|uniref:MlaD family protein n=1 Tax=Pseudoalteromonas sp. C2R02 TaxID=2841565 RepID=UPI001C08F2D8|nr:MlaD family protein [Pseudoalteromonas sp. C2R02]MBU2970584.1 MCE family protein [Pseudoalteromonas sp. C2R02]
MSFSLPQSFKTSPQEKLVGLFIIFAFSAFIYLSTIKNGLITPEQYLEFKTNVKQSFGITLGAPVKLAGVDIGKVTSINLLKTGQVEISISLPSKYENLYKSDSYLKIDSQLGFDTMLIGQGMIFIPGTQLNILKDGEFINTKEPQSLADLTKEFNVAESSKKIGKIIANIDNLTSNLVEQKQHINSILINVDTLITSLIKTSVQIDSSIETFDTKLIEISDKISPVISLMELRLVDSEKTFKSTTEFINELKLLSREIKPSIKKVPTTLNQLDNTLLEIELLSKKIKNSWILGSNPMKNVKKQDGSAIPYYNNKESVKDLLKTPIQGEISEQTNK